MPGRHRLRPTGKAFPKQHGCPVPERISMQVQEPFGKCAWKQRLLCVENGVQINANPNACLLFVFASPRTATILSLLTISLSVFVPRSFFHHTVLIVPGHSAGGTLHPGLLVSQWDRNGRSGGQFCGSLIRKPQRKEQSAFKQSEGGAQLKLFFFFWMEKVCKIY